MPEVRTTTTRPAEAARRSAPIPRPTDASPDPLVRWEQFAELGLLLGRKQVRVLIKKNQFPKPIRYSPGRVAWRLSTLHQYIDDCVDRQE
jgi:predicted DNA-binding transcriptional regulator AlpA